MLIFKASNMDGRKRNGNDVMSDSSSSTSAYESSDEEFSCEEENCLYLNEPEYDSTPESSEIPTDSDESNADSRRLENLHWCTCSECVIWNNNTIDECICCQETKVFAGRKA